MKAKTECIDTKKKRGEATNRIWIVAHRRIHRMKLKYISHELRVLNGILKSKKAFKIHFAQNLTLFIPVNYELVFVSIVNIR